jgi:hypothetical protein
MEFIRGPIPPLLGVTQDDSANGKCYLPGESSVDCHRQMVRARGLPATFGRSNVPFNYIRNKQSELLARPQDSCASTCTPSVSPKPNQF